MKTLNIEVIKKTLGILAAVGFLGLTACSKNNGGTSTNNRWTRGTGWQNNGFGANGNPSTGWGCFQGPSPYNQILVQFMPQATDLQNQNDPVAGNCNDASGTGVLFRGNISMSSGQGQIGILIKDAIYLQSGQAYFPTFNVLLNQSVTIPGGGSYTTNVGNNGATIVATDSDGSNDGAIVLTGGFSNGMWSGQAYFVNNSPNNAYGQLANFSIPGQYIFTN